MSDDTSSGTEAKPKGSRRPLAIGLVLMLALGGGAFFVMRQGLVSGFHPTPAATEESQPEALPDIAFVPVEPIVIALGPDSGGRFLRLTAEIEVARTAEAEMQHILPRVADVLNTYLRAVDLRDLEDPAALVRLRAQMLRRVQMVAGEGRVRDFLVTEFVIN